MSFDFKKFMDAMATFSALLGTAHTTLTALAPSFPNAAGGVAHVDATIQALNLAAKAAGADSGTPDAHVAQIQSAIPAVVAAAVVLKQASDAFKSQQDAGSGA